MKTTFGFLCLAVVAFGSASACHRGARSQAVAEPPRDTPVVVLGELTPELEARFEARLEAALARPEVNRAMDALIERAFGDAALGALAAHLLDQLMADPKAAADVESITDGLAEHPELQRRVRRIMEEHPELSSDQVGERLSAQVEREFDVHFAAKFEAACQRLVDRLEVGAELARLEVHLLARFGAPLAAYLETPARRQARSRRLIELNHGRVPEPALATSLFIDHALSEERLARYLTEVLGDPAITQELIGLLRGALKVTAVNKALLSTLRRLVSDAEVRRHATAGLVLLMLERPDPAQVSAVVDGIFGAPSVVKGSTEVARAILTSPEVTRSLDVALERLGKLSSLRQASDELLDRW